MVTNNAANNRTGASGKVLQGQGVGTASDFSTATYPSVATGSGTILRADGTNWVASTPTYPNAASTSGKVVVSDGTNLIMSTPTFPNASATSGKVIKSDGTNWVASTETYAAPGTSGNVLTSDGTNWTSAAPAAGSGGFALQMQVLSGNPADSSTYFMAYGQIITSQTTSGAKIATLYIPKAGTIKSCYGDFRVAGTLGSNENSTLAIRLNNTTDTTVTSTLQLTGANNAVSNGSLSISVSAGDFIEFKWTTPAWGTNPTTVTCSLSIFVLT